MKRDEVADIIKAARRQRHQELVEALREGRRERAQTFKSKKGKGSYRRPRKGDRPVED